MCLYVCVFAEKAHRRFSARDFMKHAADGGGDGSFVELGANKDKYDVVLAAASADDFDSAAKTEKQDVVLLGHHDG
jgi:hypothetical protein